MSTITKRYRIDGADEFTMEYREQSSGMWKIVAVTCPPDPYGKGAAKHHRYAVRDLDAIEAGSGS